MTPIIIGIAIVIVVYGHYFYKKRKANNRKATMSEAFSRLIKEEPDKVKSEWDKVLKMKLEDS